MPNASNTVSAGPAAVEVRGAHTPRPGPTAIPLTPPQAGAIGVIAVCGDPEAAERVVARICTQSDPKLPPIGGVHLCNFHHGNRVFDRGLLIRRNSAMFELHLHGGTAVIDMALAALAQAGANVTREPPGELPAACNIWGNQAGPTVLFQECLQAICLANSSFTLEIAAGQLTGGITRWSTLWLARLENTAVAAVDLLWKIHTESQWIRVHAGRGRLAFFQAFIHFTRRESSPISARRNSRAAAISTAEIRLSRSIRWRRVQTTGVAGPIRVMPST